MAVFFLGEPLAKMLKTRIAYHHSGLSYGARAGVWWPESRQRVLWRSARGAADSGRGFEGPTTQIAESRTRRGR